MRYLLALARLGLLDLRTENELHRAELFVDRGIAQI